MKYFICFLLGGLYTLSFSPYNIIFLSFLSVIFFLILLDLEFMKDSILKSLSFSTGYFLIGTYWLKNVINNFSDVSSLLSIAMVFIFILYLSLFIIIPIIFVTFINQRLIINKNYLLIILAILITLFEVVRAHLFTGFSWFNFGQAAINTPLDYFFPVFGVHGLTFIIFMMAIIFINIIKSGNRNFFASLAFIFVVIYVIIFNKNWTSLTNKEISISIIQPNLQNKISYSNEDILNRMNILRKMTVSQTNKNVDIILWPEAPLPIVYNKLENTFYKTIISDIPKHTSLVTGVFYQSEEIIYNSIINASNNISIYHKKHLVPFGEFLPFRESLAFLYKSIGIKMYDIKSGDNVSSINIKNFVAHSLICYESIFSKGSLIKNEKSDFIINVSNDGWFGESLAPYQHLDALIMRSLENQRYSIRSTNTGISAVISPFGEIEEYIQFNEKGVISKKIFARNGHTPISKHGYSILYLFIFAIFLYSTLYFNIKTFKR